MRHYLLILVAAKVALCASLAQAHDADVIYVQTETHHGQVTEVVTLTTATLAQLAPVDADANGELTQTELDARADSIHAGVWAQMPLTAGGQRCASENERAQLRSGFVELTATLRCAPGELRQDFRFLAVLPTNYRVVLNERLFAQGALTTLTLTDVAKVDVWSSIRAGIVRCLTLDGIACVILALLTAQVQRTNKSIEQNPFRSSEVETAPLDVARGNRDRLASAKSWCLAFGALLVGTLSSALSVGALSSSTLLALSALALVLARPRHAVATFFVGAAVGLRSGGGPASHVVGLLIGTALTLVLVGLQVLLVSPLLNRRPAIGPMVELGLLGCVLFGFARQLTATLAP